MSLAVRYTDTPEGWARADGGGKGVILCHGATATALTVVRYGTGRGLVAGLGEHGLDALAIDAGGTLTWGNPASQSALDAAYAEHGAPVYLYGASMGAVNVLVWAKANPTKVRAIALHIPAVNVIGIHDTNRNGMAANIEAAWGGAGAWAAAAATHSPYADPASYAAFPMKVWYGETDPTALPTECVAFAAASGATPVSMGAVGHTTQTLSPLELATFFGAH